MRGLTVVLALVFGLVAGGLIGKVALAPQTPAPMAEAPAPAAGGGLGAPINWKLASSLVSTTPIVGPAIEAFIDNLEVTSGGNMTLKFFEPGALVPALEVFDAVSSGSVDVGYATPGFWAGKEPALQLFAAVPFGPASAEYMAWFYYGGGQALFDEIYARHNIKGHLCGLLAPEASGWFREEITGPEDLMSRRPLQDSSR